MRPPLDNRSLSLMTAQITPTPAEPRHRLVTYPGHREFDLRYGDQYRFRVALLGEQTTHLAILARLPDAPRDKTDARA
jgi:hypothetical protein